MLNIELLVEMFINATINKNVKLSNQQQCKYGDKIATVFANIFQYPKHFSQNNHIYVISIFFFLG